MRKMNLLATRKRRPVPRFALLQAAIMLGAGALPPSGAALAAPQLTTLYTFQFLNGGFPNGRYPNGDLVLDQQGNLYGTTQAGGPACPTGQFSCGGTVFRLTRPATGTGSWALRTLHAFGGGFAGASPDAGLDRSPDGILTGTTHYGGATACKWELRGWGCGTVFQLLPPTATNPRWTKRVLHRFNGDFDGRFPTSAPISQEDGTLFGTTAEGGRYRHGLGYKVTFSTTGAAVFAPVEDTTPDREPIAQSTPAWSHFYRWPGSTRGSKPQAVIDCGDYGSYNPDTEQCECEYGYLNGNDECCPADQSDLFEEDTCENQPTSFIQRRLADIRSAAGVYRGDGSLYGVAESGGTDACVITTLGCGLVYRFVPDVSGGWQYQVLYSFRGGTDGAFPDSQITIGPDGSLYGTTSRGGVSCSYDSDGCGTAFKLTPPEPPSTRWTWTILYRFRGGVDGVLPVGKLTLDRTGAVYGATLYGGGCTTYFSGCGTVFKLTPPLPPSSQWTRTYLHRFQGGADGRWPRGGLILNAEGRLYGSTETTIFQITQ